MLLIACANVANLLLARALRRRREVPSDSRTGVALLLVQAALSMLLLVGAGLFVQSLRNVRHLRLGYDVDPVLFVHYDLRGVTLDTARTAELHDRLLASAERIPV